MRFIDLQAQYDCYKIGIDRAIGAVLAHGKFIMGPEVGQLEEALAVFSGARHVIGASSGTDALTMMMMADGIGPGDAVFVPSFTFTATAEVPILLGATPVFVDVCPDDFNIDPDDLEHRIEEVVKTAGLTPKAVLATDLFGLPADYDRVYAIAMAHGITVLSDAAQSFGGTANGRAVGTMARATATSFFPAKPLGCYGDGGAVFTDDDDLAEIMRSIRAHGKGRRKYDIVRIGLNARLDTIQAAVLLAKLPYFRGELERRKAVADRYDAALSGHVKTPGRAEGYTSARAQYTIKLPAGKRDRVADFLRERDIPTAVYYPVPMHLQTAYVKFGKGAGSLPSSERLCNEVLSLPMHPFLEESEIDAVTQNLVAAVEAA